MRRDLKILVLVLTLPLLTYSTGYAYAAVTTSTYVVTAATGIINPTTYGSVIARCATGDVATGGGFEAGGYHLQVISSRPDPDPGMPTGWYVMFYAELGGPPYVGWPAYAICMTPVTVAGISVPEFGSLYVAIILASVVYFALTKLRKPSLKQIHSTQY